MKTLFIIFSILFFSFASADETCGKLSCFSKGDIKNDPIRFHEVLYLKIKSAKGCTDKNTVKIILMSSHKVMGYVGMEEDMSRFIEKEFMANPDCILSGFNELSDKNKKTISHFLMVPTYVHGKKIRAALDKTKLKYPSEVAYIYKH